MAGFDRMELPSMALCDVSGHEAKPTMETGMPFRHGRHGMNGRHEWNQVSRLSTDTPCLFVLVYTGTPCVPLDLDSHASRRR